MRSALSPFSEEAKAIVIGSYYEHYKGPQYKVLALARHSETLEEMVVYEDSKGEIWARPVALFVENITIDGQTRQRFKRVCKT